MLLSTPRTGDPQPLRHAPASFARIAKIAFPPSSGCQPQWADSASTIRRPRPRSLN